MMFSSPRSALGSPQMTAEVEGAPPSWSPAPAILLGFVVRSYAPWQQLVSSHLSSFSYVRAASIHHPHAPSRAIIFEWHCPQPWLSFSALFPDYDTSPVDVFPGPSLVKVRALRISSRGQKDVPPPPPLPVILLRVSQL